MVFWPTCGMAFGISPAFAQNALPPVSHLPNIATGANEPAQSHTGPTTEASVGSPTTIEFRSRSAQSYGHTFSIYGRLMGKARSPARRLPVFIPSLRVQSPGLGRDNLFLVPSETGASDVTPKTQYVTRGFASALSQAEYAKVTTFIKDFAENLPSGMRCFTTHASSEI